MLHADEPSHPPSGLHLRLIVTVLLLGVAGWSTWRAIHDLETRRSLRSDLAEISHARYGLLNASVWVAKITPILDRNIDAMNLTADKATMRPMVMRALNRLLDSVQSSVTNSAQSNSALAFLGGNKFIANMIGTMIRPHLPEYADVVLAELGRQDTRDALKKYIRATLADGARNTFGDVDMRVFNGILSRYGCADAAACNGQLNGAVRDYDVRIRNEALGVLVPTALAFLLVLTTSRRIAPAAAFVLLLFCAVLLVGGILTPMLEVEAKISQLKMTFLGQPVAFGDQVLYFQSKSVLEVFRALIDTNRADMWAVGVLVLMFSVVFPILKLGFTTLTLPHPGLLRNPIVRFFALESSKWSMADVMALAIFMAFVAFNGLIPHTMEGLGGTGAELSIPTDSSKILPGYHLFIGFCIASLFLARRLSRDLRDSKETANSGVV